MQETAIMEHATEPDFGRLHDWLLNTAWRMPGIDGVLDGFCEQLLAAGWPLKRFAAAVGTLHPQFQSYYFIWQRDGGLEEYKGTHGIETTEQFLNSPFPPVYDDGASVRHRLEGKPGKLRYPILEELRDEGATDYVALPMEFGGGERTALSFAIDRPGGFTDQELLALYPAVSQLARVLEIKALRRTAVNLLDTYVGHDAGEHILSGQVRRGDMERIQAVLWYCDLRRFTTLSEQMPGPEVIVLLNEYFQVMAAPLRDAGGEVLKFVGDAMLAIIRPRQSNTPRDATCRRALTAAKQAVTDLDALNTERRARGAPQIVSGVALHVGEVLYGNIGTEDRLDYTVIGPAVNLVSRIEGISAGLGEPIVVSADFAAMAGRPMRLAGRHKLRGIAVPQDIFAPA